MSAREERRLATSPCSPSGKEGSKKKSPTLEGERECGEKASQRKTFRRSHFSFPFLLLLFSPSIEMVCSLLSFSSSTSSLFPISSSPPL